MKVIGWLDKQDVNSQWRLGRLCSGWLKQATDWSRPRTSKWSEKCRANGSLIGSIDWHHQSMDNKQRWGCHADTRYICQQSFVCIAAWPAIYCANTNGTIWKCWRQSNIGGAFHQQPKSHWKFNPISKSRPLTHLQNAQKCLKRKKKNFFLSIYFFIIELFEI